MPATSSICRQGVLFPEAERYDGYIQLENGVGMIRLMTEEVNEALASLETEQGEREEEISMQQACSLSLY